MQLAFDDQGHLVYRDFMEIVKFTVPFYMVRIAAGVIYLAGMFLLAFNVWKSVRGAKVEDDTVQVPRLTNDEPADVLLTNAIKAPAANVGDKATIFHDLVERWPTVLIVLSCVALAIGGVLEIVPSLIQGALTPRIASVTPYTPLELTGRDIYIREGCVQCHTQQIRTLRAETERYGEHHRPGEYIYDRPFLWGSKRTGPDLGREGVLKPLAAWHYDHLKRPTSVAPDSIMPNYPWLTTNDMDLSTVQRKLSVLSGAPVYTPYTKRDIDHAVSDAQAQAKVVADQLRAQKSELKDVVDLDKKEVIAVIAYLQRLGTDLNKPSAPKAIVAENR
jgi:cytochrome c oxidase cbb3-type subunit I/II